ncbi:MAG: helix-turn-helix domain-containing protein [Saprospiraceae bacterium]|nr:helix-turn-helix domain-containing protein [Saprospiraceae bacterium]
MSEICYHTFSLPAEHAELVKYGWYMEGEEANIQSYPDLLIPDACPEIIFVLEGSYEKIRLQPPHTRQVIAHSNIVGISTESLLIRRRGRVRLLGLKFKPLGFYQLFPHEIHAFINQNTPIKDHPTAWLHNLDILVRQAPDLEGKVEVISHILWQQLQNSQKTAAYQLSQQLVNHILAEKGDIQVTALAQAHHKSIRQIQRYFKQFIGLTPKQFAQIIRFKAFYKENYLQCTTASFWDYGYYDQNHFIRDFKAKLGVLPSDAKAPHFRQKHDIARKSLR